MKKNIRMILTIITFIILLPVFSGCEKDLTKAFEFIGYDLYENGKIIATTTTTSKPVYLYNFENKKIISKMKFVNNDVKSYKIAIISIKNSSSKKEKLYAECRNIYQGQEVDAFTIDSKYLSQDNKILYLEYTVYETRDCKINIGRKYESFETPEIKAFLSGGAFLDKMGKEQYCNIDANGNYSDLGEDHNLSSRIAYSQVGYSIKGKKHNLNSCKSNSDDGDSSTYYSKYGNASNIEEVKVDFVKWAAKEAGLSYLSDSSIKTIDDVIKWGKETGRYQVNTSLGTKEGNIVIYTDDDGQRNIGIVYNPAPGTTSAVSICKNANSNNSISYDVCTFKYKKPIYISLESNFLGKEVLDIVGKEGYCNTIVSDGETYYNNNFYSTTPLFVKIAFSQLDYKSKLNKENVNKCEADYTGNPKNVMYHKYGNSTKSSNINQSQLEFVKWVASKASINFPNVNNINDLIEWAKKEGRYHDKNYQFYLDKKLTQQYEGRTGDLVVSIFRPGNGKEEILDLGIMIQSIGNGYYGNYIMYAKEGVVLDQSYIHADFYIDMKGITY